MLQERDMSTIIVIVVLISAKPRRSPVPGQVFVVAAEPSVDDLVQLAEHRIQARRSALSFGWTFVREFPSELLWRATDKRSAVHHPVDPRGPFSPFSTSATSPGPWYRTLSKFAAPWSLQ